jgi:4-hydroxybenzoate polyprenyltransferase
MAAHFINVIKDMKEDRQSEIRGLPQILGTKKSILAASALITSGIALLLST